MTDKSPFGQRKAVQTTPAHIGKDVMKDIRKFVAENGGSIRAVVECGSIWIMSKGAKEYIQKLKK